VARVRLVQVLLARVRLVQVLLTRARLAQVLLARVRLVQVLLARVRLAQVLLARVRLVQVLLARRKYFWRQYVRREGMTLTESCTKYAGVTGAAVSTHSGAPWYSSTNGTIAIASIAIRVVHVYLVKSVV
jgi:hypothetical protein